MSNPDLDLLAARQRASEQATVQSEQNAPAPVDETVKVDPIKSQALRLAIDKAPYRTNPEDIVKHAEAFEQYLRGDDSHA